MSVENGSAVQDFGTLFYLGKLEFSKTLVPLHQ